MPITHLKSASRSAQTGQTDVRAAVAEILDAIALGGEAAVQKYARELDGWHGPVIVSPQDRARAGDLLSPRIKDDIRFAHTNIRNARPFSTAKSKFFPAFLPGKSRSRSPQRAVTCPVVATATSPAPS